jgi:hypothetical protein
MKTLSACALWLALIGASTPVFADDSALRQCRALADNFARLACYDLLPLKPLPAASAAAVAPAPAAAAAPAAPAVPPRTAEAGFGLDRPSEQAAQIVSRIEGRFEGWSPRERIRLANGQVWQVVDDSNGVYDLRDPKVTVKRGALGGYVMDIDGANRTPRVRRVE